MKPIDNPVELGGRFLSITVNVVRIVQHVALLFAQSIAHFQRKINIDRIVLRGTV